MEEIHRRPDLWAIPDGLIDRVRQEEVKGDVYAGNTLASCQTPDGHVVLAYPTNDRRHVLRTLPGIDE